MGHCNILSCNYFAKVWETFAKVKFSLDKIQLVKRNESAWNYLRVCVNSLILCSTLLSRLTFVWWESISCLCEWPSISISCFLSLVDENMTQGSSGRLHWFGLCQWTAWTRWFKVQVNPHTVEYGISRALSCKIIRRFCWLPQIQISRALLAEGCDSPYLLGFLVELIQWRLDSEQDDAKVKTSEIPWNCQPIFQASKLVSEAEDLCKRLSCELDVIRAR